MNFTDTRSGLDAGPRKERNPKNVLGPESETNENKCCW